MAALTLKTVFEQTRRKYQLKLLAGENGLHRSLRWLYFSEDIENAEFLRGGELVMLTGFDLQKREDFEAFIRMLVSKNACGVIINVGKYIYEEDLSADILEECNQKKFPMITMPWKYHLTDIIQDYSHQIFFRNHEQNRLGYIFQMLIHDKYLYTLEDETRLTAHQFNPEGKYHVAVLSCFLKNGGKLPVDVLHSVEILIQNHLNLSDDSVCAFSFQSRQVLVFHEMEEERLKWVIGNILGLCCRTFSKQVFYCGVGTEVTGVEQLRESYRRGTAALAYGVVRNEKRVFFSDLGVVQLFFTCQDQAILLQFASILMPLEQYDAQYGTALMETLRLYLEFHGSVNLVSEEMFCHRNTTNYRIRKIKSILGSELDDRTTMFRLQLAFYIKEYLEIFPAEK